ncbi:hypothetical protein K474DRAFT_1667136 [Panus rudis PR-1116 ss-1]|nr:hypothetical protein K474DRAFT_1667136 [Panus rudis PR-1116 ss-1]
MVITCDALPAEWKVVLEPPENRSHFLSLPRATTTEPITVGDILVAIHKMLHTRISHRDWVKLSRTDEVEVARAYSRRCRTFPSVEQYDAYQGVRRVDYLKEKFIFKGLIRRRGEQGFEHVKLLTGPKL